MHQPVHIYKKDGWYYLLKLKDVLYQSQCNDGKMQELDLLIMRSVPAIPLFPIVMYP